MKYVKIINLTAILLISILFLTGASCQGGQGAQPTPTPTPTQTPAATVIPTSTPAAAEPTPTATATATTEATPAVIATLGPEGCVPDRDAIQAAIYAYHADKGDWPTANGEPGDIAWAKLVKEYLPFMPHTNDECNWQVNGNPVGGVCVPLDKLC
jgi:hypothetical protein